MRGSGCVVCENSSDILMKNVPEKLLVAHAKDIQNGNLRCRVEWEELVANIEAKDKFIHQVNWEDVELWIMQQTDNGNECP
jgi:hypothetical protein